MIWDIIVSVLAIIGALVVLVVGFICVVIYSLSKTKPEETDDYIYGVEYVYPEPNEEVRGDLKFIRDRHQALETIINHFLKYDVRKIYCNSNYDIEILVRRWNDEENGKPMTVEQITQFVDKAVQECPQQDYFDLLRTASVVKITHKNITNE